MTHLFRVPLRLFVKWYDRRNGRTQVMVAIFLFIALIAVTKYIWGGNTTVNNNNYYQIEVTPENVDLLKEIFKIDHDTPSSIEMEILGNNRKK